MLEMTLRDKLASHGGFTVRIEHAWCPSEYITSGYALSLHPEYELSFNANDLTGEEVAAVMLGYVIEHKDVFVNPNTYFGAWYDSETDKIYLDISTVVDDEAKALELAAEHNQLAVFHLDTGSEIRVA